MYHYTHKNSHNTSSSPKHPTAIGNVVRHGTLVLFFDYGKYHLAIEFILHKTYYKPVHEVWLRSEENEVSNDKSLNAILSCKISNMIVRHSKVLPL